MYIHLGVIGNSVCVSQYLYGSPSLPVFAHLMYNAVKGGANLYGAEPPSYYVK